MYRIIVPKPLTPLSAIYGSRRTKINFSPPKLFEYSKYECLMYSYLDTINIYEGGLKSFRPQHEDGSTRQ